MILAFFTVCQSRRREVPGSIENCCARSTSVHHSFSVFFFFICFFLDWLLVGVFRGGGFSSFRDFHEVCGVWCVVWSAFFLPPPFGWCFHHSLWGGAFFRGGPQHACDRTNGLRCSRKTPQPLRDRKKTSNTQGESRGPGKKVEDDGGYRAVAKE